MPHAGASSTSDLGPIAPTRALPAVLAGSRDRMRYRSPREPTEDRPDRGTAPELTERGEDFVVE